MFRSERRTRQRPNYAKETVIGMRHEEELAVRRAQYASLFGDKTPPKKSPASDSKKQDPPRRSSSPIRSPVPMDTSTPPMTPLKRLKTLPGYDFSSPSSSSVSSPPGSFGALCRSPLSSPMGSPGSIDSSLRLVLSTSTGSTSSSSNWSLGHSARNSTTPSSPGTGSSKTPSKVGTKKRKAGTPTGKAKKEKTNGKSKQKLVIDSSLFGCASPVKGKAKSPKSTKSSPKQPGKSPKSTKIKKKSPKSLIPLKLKGTNTNETETTPLSPEAVLVMHDHCYFAGSLPDGDHKGITSVDTHQKSITSQVDPTQMEPNHSSSPNSCSYQAQRKFAHNPMPAHSPKPSSEGFQKLKEIPKTEDFLSFLCLRGTTRMPKGLQKFSKPWTPLVKVKNGKRISVRVRSLSGNNGKGYKSRPSVSKKLEFLGSHDLQ